MKAILGTIALEPNRWTGKRNPRYSLLELLPLARDYGFDKLEVWQWHASTRYLKDMREVKAKADELGISFPYIGVYPAFILDGPDGREEERIQADVLDKAEILGTRALKIMLGVGLKGSAATPELVAKTADRFGAWYRAAKARGISMAVELHGGTMFDPVESGIAFMARYPELDFSICYQPYDFTDTAKGLALADRFAGRISHIHLQAPQPREKGGKYDLLEDSPFDFRQLIPHILRRNPAATMTLEFVRDCIQNDTPFDIKPVLESARRDGEFVDRVIAGMGPAS
jgi:sugar phosphate isomerase/epimerase